ncbi:hypothetical protein [Halobaculum sp. EA56]|uniref:hypothetical protein n=1 Tax=Halobaculum sp. EA56 TaxID=3421648 RepID=UPI003EBB3583
MFEFETRFWITVAPALTSIAVGVAAGAALDRPPVVVAGVAVAVAWAVLAYAACTALGYGVGDAPEYEPRR